MDTLNLDLNKKYSYADYLTWLDDKRRELINGFVKMMTPAPRRIHQEISNILSGELYLYLKKKNVKFILLLLTYVLLKRIKQAIKK